MRIQINTEQVREIGQRLVTEAQQVQEMDAGLNSAVYNLDMWAWDGLNRARAEPLLAEIHPNSDQIAQQLSELGHLMQRIAQTFEQVDRDVVHPIPPSPEPWDEIGRKRTIEEKLSWWIRQLQKLVDMAMLALLRRWLPGLGEFVSLQGDAGATIPLAELGLPFSGYVSGENGITIKHNEDGSYSVIIGRAGSVGIDWSHHDVVGAQVGLRGEKGFEFQFNPDEAGDLSKMALLLTTLAGTTAAAAMFPNMGSTLAQLTDGLAMNVLSDDLVSVSGAGGVEGEIELDAGPIGELGVEGKEMVGIERRLGDQGWETVASHTVSLEAGGKLTLLEELKAERKLGYQVTLSHVDLDAGGSGTELVIEIDSSVGQGLSFEGLGEVFPPSVGDQLSFAEVDGIPGLDLDIQSSEFGKIKLVCYPEGSAQEVAAQLENGGLLDIIHSSPGNASISSGTTQTVGGEIKAGLGGQSVGVELKSEVSRGQEVTVAEW